MKPGERIVEWKSFENDYFGYYFVFVASNSDRVYSVEFEIHEVVSRAQSDSKEPVNPEFDIYGYTGSGDWTSKLEDAAPQIHGTVKWDGCSHVWFGNAPKKGEASDGYLHLCGERCWKKTCAAMLHAFKRCGELLLQAGTWNP